MAVIINISSTIKDAICFIFLFMDPSLWSAVNNYSTCLLEGYTGSI